MNLTIIENKPLNGLEVAFDTKPDTKVLGALKSNGFRWHNKKKVWYAKKTEERFNLLNHISHDEIAFDEVTSPAPTVKENKYGVKVGDLFSMTWGYSMTIQSFFQVVEVVGTASARVREVCPEKIDYTGGGYQGTFKIAKPKDLLPDDKSNVFIKDQEQGDLKRISLGYNNQPCIKFKKHHATLVTNYDREYWYNNMD